MDETTSMIKGTNLKEHYPGKSVGCATLGERYYNTKPADVKQDNLYYDTISATWSGNWLADVIFGDDDNNQFYYSWKPKN